MLVGAKVCDLTEDLLRFVCGLYVGILMSSLNSLGINANFCCCFFKLFIYPGYLHGKAASFHQ